MWYDDEYDVSLDNTLCDVVGPDLLAENYISAVFTNGDDELFHANEFLDLNKGHDPDMGLKLQASKD